MTRFEIDGVEVTTDIAGLKFNDAARILEQINASEEYPVVKLKITLDSNGNLDCDYFTQPPKFERIRRITGYLTGNLETWNNAKRAEERERVKHI